ncbi:hypothetical protein ACHAWT_005461 [Skeletonema menzelii]
MILLASSSIHEAATTAATAVSSSSIVSAAPSISDTTRRWQPSTSSSAQQAWLLNTPTTSNVTPIKTTTILQSPSSSSSIYISASSASTTTWTQQLLQTRKQSSTDKVKRVIDSSTILLEKSGIVSLDVVRGAGSTYILPECCTYAPAYKLKQLLKRGTPVKVVNLTSSDGASSSARPKVWIVRSQDDLIINREIVRTGFGLVRKGGAKMMMESTSVQSNFDYEGMMNDMTNLEETARSKGMGIFKVCDGITNDNGDDDNAVSTSNFIAEFEPMEYTTEIQYGDDGGKSVVVSNSDKQASSMPPSNPGDVRGCSDFTYYEDALGYYERYYPYYGDVAKLDRDGDGVPCPGLPHTTNQDKYRMKLPNKV